jgi:hypothetical protein
MCLAPAFGEAGTFSYVPGTWGSFTGSGAGTATAYSSDPSPNSISPSLTLTSPLSGNSFNLGATYSFSIVWTPATGDTPPANVVVTFHRQGSLIADGTGVSTILNGATQLLEMDSTNNFLSGAATNLTDVSYSFPLVLQSNGTYKASGTFVSDSLSTTFNSSNSTVTSSQETFTLYGMEASS